MEYISNGSLARVLRLGRNGSKPWFWTPTGITIIICGIVLGMRYMHSKEFTHFDLKPENIFLDANGRALIGDFGESRYRSNELTPTRGAGTPRYSAPELFSEEVDHTATVDVFSFGLILYEIVVGSAVFPQALKAFEIIGRHRTHYQPDIPSYVLPVLQELIRQCLSPNPDDRPSFSDILQVFESNDFKLLPEANLRVVRSYVRGLLDWEQMNDVKPRSQVPVLTVARSIA
jgi:serine/threonine protein kinase